MSQRFAQLSDPHLSTLDDVRAKDLLNKRALGYLSWLRRRRYEHRREVLDALQRDLDLDALDQLLVTGDLTHIGLPSEFEQARDWLRQLGNPSQVALVPGNHDACVAAPWRDTFSLWQDYMSSDDGSDTTDFPSLRVRGDIAFIGLSTGCPKPPLMATGTLGAEQMERLPTMLEHTAERGLFRVVYLHHSPVARQEKWRKRLTDAAELQALLERYGAELVIHGHGHRAHQSELITRAGSLPVIALPSASSLGLHGADVAQYNLYLVERRESGWRVEIESRRYNTKTEQFENLETRPVHLARKQG